MIGYVFVCDPRSKPYVLKVIRFIWIKSRLLGQRKKFDLSLRIVHISTATTRSRYYNISLERFMVFAQYNIITLNVISYSLNTIF